MEKVQVKKTADGREVYIKNAIMFLEDEIIFGDMQKIDNETKKKFPQAAYRYGKILLTTEQKEVAEQAMSAQKNEREARIRSELIEKEQGQPHMRMLVLSGWYLLDTEINTVYIANQEKQNEYREEFQGKIVVSSTEFDSTRIKFDGKGTTAEKIARERKPSGYIYGHGESAMWSITEEEERKIVEELKKREQEEKEKKEKHEAELAKQAAAEKEAMENEVMFFGDELLSSVGFSMLHSLAAQVVGDKISVYTTGYAKEIGGKTTCDMREEAEREGFSWNEKDKTLEIENTKENRDKVVVFLKKHDVKANPYCAGYGQCWECGCWVKRKQLDENGYCGC